MSAEEISSVVETVRGCGARCTTTLREVGGAKASLLVGRRVATASTDADVNFMFSKTKLWNGNLRFVGVMAGGSVPVVGCAVDVDVVPSRRR